MTIEQRLLVKVVRDLVRVQAFDTHGDLVRAVQHRLASLHIRYQVADLDAALAAVIGVVRVDRDQASALITKDAS